MSEGIRGPRPSSGPPDTALGEGQAPTLREQFLGVFTDPVPLFRRLGAQPRWGWALATVVACALASGLVWATRVDANALLRPVLATDPRVPPEQMEAMIAFQGKLLWVAQAVNVLVGIPALTFLLAGLMLLFLAARHILRLRTAAALACVVASVAISTGLLVLGAR